MRIHQFGSDLELRVQFPSGVSGLTSGQIAVSLFLSTDSSGGGGNDTQINLAGLVGVSEVNSTGIYRINIDNTAFTVDPSSTTEPVLYYAKITESNGNTVVNVPMFEVSTLGSDELAQEVLGLSATTQSEIDTAFTTRDANINTLADALGAVYDSAQPATLLGQTVADGDYVGDEIGQRLVEISDTLRAGGDVSNAVTSADAKLGTSADSGSTTAFGLLNQILEDSSTTVPDLVNNLLGEPAGASVSDDVAAVKADTASALTTLGAPAGASVSADVAAVKSDTASALTTLGTPAGASVSADVAAVQAAADNIAALIGTPAQDMSLDVAAVKTDATTMLTRLGSSASSASLSSDLFGAIKYLAAQAQSSSSTGALPARASIEFPTTLLAPQGTSNKYIKIKVLNRNRLGQLERPRALGDGGTVVNGSASFFSVVGNLANNTTLSITVNGVTEVWTFLDINSNVGAVSGLVSAGVGRFVYDANDGLTGGDLLLSIVLPTLRLSSDLDAVFDLDDANTDRLLICPADYETMSVVVSTNCPNISTTQNSSAKGGVGAMFARVLVDGVASQTRFFKDALGASEADYSLAANSTSDGGLGRNAPSPEFAAMIGGDSAGEFFLFYKLSAGQQENLSFEIFGLDKNANLDSLGNVSDSIVSEIKAVAHCSVQAPSLNQLGIAF